MMGSAAATCLNLVAGKSTSAVQGDAPAGESDAGFQAALGAAVPVGASGTQQAVKALPAVAEESTTEETSVNELAAVIAAMLQTTSPADEAAVAGNTDVETAAQGNAASLAGNAPAASALLASVRAAIKGIAADAATSADAGDADSSLWQALAAKSEADGASPVPQARIGLRQLLQMMGQQTTAPQMESAAAQARADNPVADIAAAPPALKLAQGGAAFAEAVTAATHNASDQPAPVQPANAAPNSLLAAASTNFGSPVHQPATATADPSATLHAAVGTARWADELGSKLALMTLRGQHEGSLNLTPEHLGPVEVRISVNQNTANVFFGAQHADTRAAINEAMPRLRELLGDAGLTLGQSGVSHQAPRHGSRAGEAQRQSDGSIDGIGEVAAATPAIARPIALGLVDTYV
jgi:flagellar hook-length control protein FliK